ncbi:PREDICTED: EF-hand and coiled-coil domain-containing protein 1 [Corvus brachyrhynchos]|nr:PREDICTED: EF-hand and coiled-coil domain-containing protein 1 [Corvus brachyrhynchos]
MSTTEPQREDEGVSAGRTSPAPLLVPARKPGSHRRGPPKGKTQAKGEYKDLKPSELLDQMLSDLERRREMNQKTVLKASFPGGSNGSVPATAAGREAMPGTGTGDWDRDLHHLESLVNDGLRILELDGSEPVGDGQATSQPMSTTEPQREDEGRSRPFPWESCVLGKSDKNAQETPSSPRVFCPQDVRKSCMVGTVVTLITVPLSVVLCYVGFRWWKGKKHCFKTHQFLPAFCSWSLQVGLRKSHASHKEEGTCFIGSKRPLTQNHSQTKCLQSVLKEMELIRSSRDGQIEEAIKFNQELERELKSSQEALVSLEDCNRNLKREQAEMRRKVEEARHAVLNSLGKVKELEEKANEVPHLQIYIQQLESQLQHYRSERERSQVPCRGSVEQQEGAAVPGGTRSASVAPRDQRSPTGIADHEDQLFRSVEGQAASDEEEEKWAGDRAPQLDHVKKILAKLPCCGSGCDEKTWRKLLSYLEATTPEGSGMAPAEPTGKTSPLTEQLELQGHPEKKLETNMEEMKGPLLGELQQKVEETELLKMELQMLETERVRLSLVEEKLMDVLQLLQQLRDLNISKRALGKILLSTLESCRDPQPGKAQLFEVLDTLRQELAACELLHRQPMEQAQSPRSLSNPLVISC